MPGHGPLDNSVDVLQAVPPQSMTGGAVNGALIDTSGWDGIEFHINIGAITGAGTLDARLTSGANSNGSDQANVANATLTQVTNANPNAVAVLSLYRSTNRYVRVILTQATNTVVAGAQAVLYRRNGVLPPTHTPIQTVFVQQN